jgi:hypothetical protein
MKTELDKGFWRVGREAIYDLGLVGLPFGV